MKKFITVISFIFLSILISGAGYNGILPDLDVLPKDYFKQERPVQRATPTVLPLDKLTIPVKAPVKVDKVLDKYKADMADAIRQLERLKEILDGDKSFKNFIAAANILNLTTQNITGEFQESRFYPTNTTLENICYDVQQIKDYWIKVAKNAPYVSHYTTQGAYSGEVLNNQLNSFSNVLEHAIRDLKSKSEKIE